VASRAALTSRQLEVLTVYARTASRKETAHLLGIAHRTVVGHLTQAYARLDVISNIEAFAALGWLVVPDEEVVDTRMLVSEMSRMFRE
jgi:DNA-binding CsgD family transcriptional regulator